MRIVIIEDEMCIREGLAKLLGRIDSNYLIVGEADNGKSGLDLILASKPDLIITDVQMPVMDGLEMLYRLQEEGFSAKTIILSAYSEFSYAQQAIKLGVSEYLIKPIMINELTLSLRSVEQQLAEESQKKEHSLELQSLAEVFSAIQIGRLKVNEEIKEYVNKKFAINLNDDFILILAYLGDYFEEERKRTIPVLHTLLRNTISKDCQLLDFLAFKSCLFLFPCKEEESLLVKRLQKAILPRLGTDKPIGFGWIKFSGIGKLAENIGIIRSYMDWNITLGNGVIIHYPRIKQLQTSPLSYPLDIENQMKTALCMANQKKLQEAFRNFQNYFRKDFLYEPRKIKESYLRFIWSVINVAKELDLSQFLVLEQQALLESIMGAVTNDELEKTMSKVLKLAPKDEEDEDDKMRLVIRRTKSLIHEFYARGITLEEIAEKLNVTPEYLGSQFHKEIGVTFSTYMKEYRIQKAKKLLIGTNLKLYEIAEQVGYGTPKYFSRIFREITGQFPAEYRKLNK